MWAGPRPGKLSALGSPGSRRLGAREANSAAARWCKSSEARRARWTLRRCCRSRGASVSLVHSSRSQFVQSLEQLAMASRKNAKGGGGNSSSSGSGSGSGSPSTGSSGSSSSPGARRGQSPRRPGPGCGREPGGRCRLVWSSVHRSSPSLARLLCARGEAALTGRGGGGAESGREGPSTGLPEHCEALPWLSWWKLGVEGPLSSPCRFRGA